MVQMRIPIPLLCLTLCLFFDPADTQSQGLPDGPTRASVAEVIAQLPPFDSMRRTLKQGHFGDGVHAQWMDEMKRAGVKTASFEVSGVWHTVTLFQPEKIVRIIYRSRYAGPNSQITDPEGLTRLRTSGLQSKLQEAAFQKSTKATWIGIDSPPREGDQCIVDIYLYDNEWLADDAFSTTSPGIGRYNPEEFPLAYAALAGDIRGVKESLSAQQFPEDRLNTALFVAVQYPADNTDVISALLQAGANVNAMRTGGSTLIMDAAAHLTVSNVQLLLSSGANLSAKTSSGQTAYDIALEQIKQITGDTTSLPAYATQLLELLKPAVRVVHP
jgi:hypothetical protein